MDLSKANTLIELLTLQLSRASHHKGHWIKNNTTTSNTHLTKTSQWKRFGWHSTVLLSCFLTPNTDSHFETLFQNTMILTYVSLCGWTMILACNACGLWEHKYRAGCIGHDQSIQAGKSEWSTDIIKSQTAGLHWIRYGLQNGRDRGVWWTRACAHFWKTRSYWMSDDNCPNKLIMVIDA